METSFAETEIMILYALLGLLLVGVGYLVLSFKTMRSDIECMHETMHEFFEDAPTTIGDFLTELGFDPSEIKGIEESINGFTNSELDNNSETVEDWDSGNSIV
jgi:hypothetical protein